jgi:hypothetical protein
MSNAQLDIQTAERFLAMKLPPKESLIDGLLSRRDLITLGARRRHGKTTFVMQLACDGAIESSFLGYTIPAPFRTLLLLLEDDVCELQNKLLKQKGERDFGERVALYTREDLLAQDINIATDNFKAFVRDKVNQHRPHLIVLDNLAQFIDAEYNDPKRIQQLMKFTYALANESNAAILICAHPRKRGKDDENVHLAGDSERFFETIMGSSHLINSTGSLWGLERRRDLELDQTHFVGGQQRVDGHSEQIAYLEFGDDGRFSLVKEAAINLPLVLNTAKRAAAWRLLPPVFGFEEGLALVQFELKRDAYSTLLKSATRLNVLEQTRDAKYRKLIERAPMSLVG